METSNTASGELADVEQPRLTIGFLPITCATPIIMAAPLRIYEKYGLDITVKKFSGWAKTRDAAIAGEIDAAHLLAPIPITTSLGARSTLSAPLRLAAVENVNGSALTLAMKHLGNVESPADLAGMRLAIPFEFSIHNLLLRAYLASGGLDATDVDLPVMRPPDMVANLKLENIDGFFVADPFNQRAVYEGAGYIHLLSKEMWDGHPCCSFSVRQTFINENPRTYQTLLQTIVEATNYSQKVENREEIAEAIAPTEYLNQPPEVVKAVLAGHFDNGRGETIDDPKRIGFDPYPWKSFAIWIETQLVR